MKGHHWIKVGVIDVLVTDEGNKPVLLWWVNPAEAPLPRPPEPDIVGIASETGWSVTIDRVWGTSILRKGRGFLWRVTCRAQLRTGVSNRDLAAIPQEWYGQTQGDREVTQKICEASGLLASSGTYRLIADWDGFKRGTFLVWTYANGSGYLAIGEVLDIDTLVWSLAQNLPNAPWSTPGGDS